MRSEGRKEDGGGECGGTRWGGGERERKEGEKVCLSGMTQLTRKSPTAYVAVQNRNQIFRCVFPVRQLKTIALSFL